MSGKVDAQGLAASLNSAAAPQVSALDRFKAEVDFAARLANTRPDKTEEWGRLLQQAVSLVAEGVKAGKSAEINSFARVTRERGGKVICLTWKPDSEIFETIEPSFDTLSQRLRELSFLNKGLKITVSDEREGDKKHEFQYAGGIQSFVEYLNKKKEPLHHLGCVPG